ncbi:hypothetical protein SprV_0100402800 [Sparganum proliferum]
MTSHAHNFPLRSTRTTDNQWKPFNVHWRTASLPSDGLLIILLASSRTNFDGRIIFMMFSNDCAPGRLTCP